MDVGAEVFVDVGFIKVGFLFWWQNDSPDFPCEYTGMKA
jgi:hypothetical protein